MYKNIDYELDTKAIFKPDHRQEGISLNQITYFVIEDTNNGKWEEIISRRNFFTIKDDEETRYCKQVSFHISKGIVMLIGSLPIIFGVQ